MNWKQRLRLVPTLKNITEVRINDYGTVTAMGYGAKREDIYQIRRLPRTLRLMVILTVDGYGDIWEWSARDYSGWFKRVKPESRGEHGRRRESTDYPGLFEA